MKTTLIALVCSLCSSSALAGTETKEFDSAGTKTLVVENSSGDVKVIGMKLPGKIQVVYEKIQWSEKCNLEFSQKNEELRVIAEASSMFQKENCKINMTIKAPAQIVTQAKMGSGDLKIDDLKGNVSFKLGSGDVHIKSEVPKLEGMAGSGRVFAEGLTGPVDLKTGSGAVQLTYSKAPAWGELNVKSGSGDIEINFPANSKFATDYWAGTGKLTNEFATIPDGPFKVIVKTGAGDLKIRKIK